MNPVAKQSDVAQAHYTTPTSPPLQAPKMSFTAALMQTQDASAILEKLEKLTSSFAVLALAMKQSSDEFKAAALQFSTAVDAIRAAPQPPPIDTATPAAEKAAAAIAAASAAPETNRNDTVVLNKERDDHYDAMDARCDDYKERLRHLWSYEMRLNVGRMNDYRDGCIRTLPAPAGGNRRVLIYKYHAFEMPTDRSYHIPGPLVSIGAIDPDSKAIRPLLTPPELPTTQAQWPWC